MRFDERFNWWRGTIRLAGFRDLKIDVPGLKSTSRAIELRVEADDGDAMEAQMAAYTHLLASQSRIRGACLRGIAKTAKFMRPILQNAGWITPERLDELLPNRPTADALRTRLRLYDVCITDRVKGNAAHIEYSFGCAWDQEHGLLIVLQRDRLVYSGLTGSGW